MTGTPKKILTLICDSGGGHRASAEALRAAFTERYGTAFHMDIVDLWRDYTVWPINQMPDSYRFLTTDTPKVYELVWKASATSKMLTPLLQGIAKWVEGPIGGMVLDYNPDLIISVHPLMQQVPLVILERMGRRLPFVTVITDLGTIHPTWYHTGVDLCFVPSQAAYEQGLSLGLSPAQLRVRGLPIRPDFARGPRPRDVLRRELGLLPDRPAVLIVGGGEGIGPVAKIAKAVAGRLAEASAARGEPAPQLAIICGRNKKLTSEMEAHDWPVPALVRGFVSNMADWMAACDCIITKAGPGTIAEALTRGLPILLSGYIPGQEEGNVVYVLENEVGVYAERPDHIAQIISGWMGPQRDEMLAMAGRARQLGRPQSSFQIVDDIARLAAERLPVFVPATKTSVRLIKKALKAPKKPRPSTRRLRERA